MKTKEKSCLGCPFIWTENELGTTIFESFCKHPSLTNKLVSDSSLGVSTDDDFCKTPNWCPKLAKDNNAVLISASEASRLTEESKTECSSEILAKINNQILEAAKKGNSEIYYSGSINEQVREILTDAGYRVRGMYEDGDSTPYSIHIWWSST